MNRLGRRFARNKAGQTTIEFAFVLVPFFALMFSVFENGFLLMCDSGLSQANTDAARQLLIGSVQQSSAITTADEYRDQLICSPTAPVTRILPTYIDCSKIIVDVQSLKAGQNFSQTSGNDFYTTANTNSFCTGASSDIVMVRLMYPMPAYFPIFTNAFLRMGGVSTAGLTTYGGNLVHVVLSTVVFQSEPYSSGTLTPKPGCTAG